MQSFGTKAAAEYLTQHGKRISKSRLEKFRMRGPEDPRDPGPDWYRDSDGKCWYPQEALDRYLQSTLSDLKLREKLPQPSNLRRMRTSVELTCPSPSTDTAGSRQS